MKVCSETKWLLVILLLLGMTPLQAQVTIEITRVPGNTPAADTLFLAGNLNNWNPRSQSHAFQRQGENRFVLTLPATVGELVYKITRGSWEKGEMLANGAARANRTYKAKPGADTLRIEVENWQDNFPTATKTHTASDNVHILSNQFWMPQLEKSRRIWLYLPPSYANSTKRFPVLYMHDGQNLFDSFYSFGGSEWGVDESLDEQYEKEGREVIVVGIDNGEEDRLHEYMPWDDAKHGEGKGDAYVDFLVQTLKPYIDSHYRTLPDRTHTAIAGSSMGGLISFYAALKYPEVFGKAGIFSPAFWIAPNIYKYARTKPPKDSKIFLLAGAKEGEKMVPDMARMRDLLLKKGINPSNLRYEVHEDGEHTEAYWQREFPRVFKWLFSK